MRHYRQTKQVRIDLRKIGLYSDKEWGTTQRRQYLARMVKCFEGLGKHPEHGKACDEILPGYRKYPEGKHVIFYRICDDGIVEIVRVLHERMDFSQHLIQK